LGRTTRPDTFFELRLVELPHLQLHNREVVEARLTSRVELERMTLTGVVAAYLSVVAGN
jgi:hypothetical protein